MAGQFQGWKPSLKSAIKLLTVESGGLMNETAKLKLPIGLPSQFTNIQAIGIFLSHSQVTLFQVSIYIIRFLKYDFSLISENGIYCSM